MKARSSDGERRGLLFTLVDIAGEEDIDALDLGANPTPPTVSRTSIGDLAAEGLKDDGWRYESAADPQLLLPDPNQDARTMADARPDIAVRIRDCLDHRCRFGEHYCREVLRRNA